jgi:hypothetical protein
MAGAPRAATEASRTSPLTTPAGTGRTRLVAVALAAELADRKVIAPAGAAGAVVNVQLTGSRALGVEAVSLMAPVRRAV